ncbi:GNAT family N-acetyltransferase [Lachnospiraceae bacterium 45-W7]
MDVPRRRNCKMDGRIRYLEQWEKHKTRSLYETAFREDSREFVDYYYQWKMKDNEVIVMEEGQSVRDGFFHVMMHANPYILWINGRLERIPYLVAVATAPFCRRQGKMGRVLRYFLQDLEHKRVPFTFLLPADPAYYKGQGFVFFPDMNLTGVIQKTGRGTIQAAAAHSFYSDRNWQPAGKTDIPQMMEFSDKVLRARHDMVISRDQYYYLRLLAETAVEHGGILLLRHKGELRGMLTYAQAAVSETQLQDRVEIKELLLEEMVLEEEGIDISRDALKSAKAAGTLIPEAAFGFGKMMVRITSLAAVVPLLKSRGRRSLYVKVFDPVIEKNNGCFRIILDSSGGSIRRIAEKEVRVSMDIAALTRELFKDVSVYLNEWV